MPDLAPIYLGSFHRSLSGKLVRVVCAYQDSADNQPYLIIEPRSDLRDTPSRLLRLPTPVTRPTAVAKFLLHYMPVPGEPPPVFIAEAVFRTDFQEFASGSVDVPRPMAG